MPAEQSDAIVLRLYPWSETSVVASIYSREFGKLSVLAKGARRPKSPFEAALDLLSVCRVVFISKSSDALDILTEAKLVRRFRIGSRDLLRLYAGYYVAELLDRLTDKGERQPEIYDLAEATLAALADLDLEIRAIVLRWELQMLRLSGQLPSWQQCAQCGTAVESDKWHSFSILAGGVWCPDCRGSGQYMLRVPPGVIDTLRVFSSPQWKSQNLEQLSTENRAALRGVVTKYLMAVLDRKLQMHPYLEELGR